MFEECQRKAYKSLKSYYNTLVANLVWIHLLLMSLWLRVRFSGHSSGSNLLDKTLISAEHIVPNGIALLWKMYFRGALTDAEGFLHYVWMVYLSQKSHERHLQLLLFGFCSSKPSTQAVRLGPCGLSVCSSRCPLLCYNI